MKNYKEVNQKSKVSVIYNNNNNNYYYYYYYYYLTQLTQIYDSFNETVDY